MENRIVLILKEDIMLYPPVLSIINVLIELKYQVIHIGVYSDEKQKQQLENRGVLFLPTIKYNGKDSLLKKFYTQLYFRHQVKAYIKKLNLTEEDSIWMMQTETVYLLNSLVGKYRTILHFFEFADSKVNWKYRLLVPSFSMAKTIRKAHKVICCEYNRAQILKGLFQLDVLPYVLPNKPYIDESKLNSVPSELKDFITGLSAKLEGKKVILYQGIFLDAERRLEEFCQAIQRMPAEYVFLAMGRSTQMYEELKKKYASDKILFLPFIKPPYHLLVTRLASIGVLSYFPRPKSISSILNPLYCAPNKIFEYAKFGIPMISNDIPGLHYIYLEYKCGECIPYPMTSQHIEDTIENICRHYDVYSQGGISYYNSVDFKQILINILDKF